MTSTIMCGKMHDCSTYWLFSGAMADSADIYLSASASPMMAADAHGACVCAASALVATSSRMPPMWSRLRHVFGGAGCGSARDDGHEQKCKQSHSDEIRIKKIENERQVQQAALHVDGTFTLAATHSHKMQKTNTWQ